MSGHSKWANIKHRKARQDAKKGKLFANLIREIATAARGGGDPADNPRLRMALDKGRAANMGSDTAQRAIERGSGGANAANLEEVSYEGYAPGGIAVLVKAITDNHKRTVAEIRHPVQPPRRQLGHRRLGGLLFQRQARLVFAPGTDEERVMEATLSAGAEDIETDDDGAVSVIADPARFHEILEACQAAGLTPEDAEIAMLATSEVPVDAETADKVIGLVDALEDHDDVQNVYSNAEFPDGWSPAD